MANNKETFESVIYVNGEQAQESIAKMRANLEKLNAEYEKVVATNGEFSKEALKLRKEIDKQTASIANAEKGVDNFEKAMKNLDGSSLKELTRLQKALNDEIKKTKPNTKEFDTMSKQYQEVTAQITKVRNAQKGLSTETSTLGGVWQRVTKFGNKFGLAIMAIPTAVKGFMTALRGVINVTKQVINSSQSMSDKWNNGIAAMKTVTQSFFAALSSGDWTAFNKGISEALKKARDLAEVMDTLGSFKISEGYMQSSYLVDYNRNVATATDTESDDATRRAAIDAAQKDLEAYNEFIKRESEATFDALMLMFETAKGITFGSRDEFDEFFDELFRNVTTGGNETVNEIRDFVGKTVAELTQMKVDGDFIYSDYTKNEAMTIALQQATEKYGQSMVDLYRASELNDEKLTQLVQTYSQYRASVDKAAQLERNFNRTRDRVLKQVGEYGQAIKAAEKAKDAEIAIYKQMYADGEIDREEFEKNIARIETEWKQQQLDIATTYGQDTTAIEGKILDERVKLRDAAYSDSIKNVDAQEKAQLLVLKRNYAAGIINEEDYEAEKTKVQLDYMKRRLALAEKFGQDTNQLENQILDVEIQVSTKAKKEAYAADLKDLEDAQKAEEDVLQESRANREISEQDFEAGMTQIKMAYLQKRLELVKQHGLDTVEAERAIYDAQVAATEEAMRKLEGLKATAQEVKDKLDPESAQARELEEQMAMLDTLHEAQLLSEEEYQEALNQLREESEQKSLEESLKRQEAYIKKRQDLLNAASNFASALQNLETAQLEAEYQQRLTAAGDNAAEREKIEAEYEQKKLDMQKKYADVDMVMNIAKAIAAGALAAVEAFAAAGGNPILGGVFAAIIAATTAAEVATIIAQRNAIKNASVGGGAGGSSASATGSRTVTGFSEGGYTGRAQSDSQPAGIVHANEWVAPAWMVRADPVRFADLEHYRRTGQPSHSQRSLGGFAAGGYTGNNAAAVVDSKDIASAVADAVGQAMRNNPVRSYVVRNDITELDKQTERFKQQTSR